MTMPQKPTGEIHPHECEGMLFKQIQEWNQLKIKEHEERLIELIEKYGWKEDEEDDEKIGRRNFF